MPTLSRGCSGNSKQIQVARVSPRLLVNIVAVSVSERLWDSRVNPRLLWVKGWYSRCNKQVARVNPRLPVNVVAVGVSERLLGGLLYLCCTKSLAWNSARPCLTTSNRNGQMFRYFSLHALGYPLAHKILSISICCIWVTLSSILE